MLGLAIPLYDEEALAPRVVRDLIDALEDAGEPFVLALVDNGSTDGTGAIVDELAQDPRILAVHLSPNAGYGGGIQAGVQALLCATGVDLVGWAWGDGQVDPRVLAPLARACRAGAMLAKARRFERQDGLRRLVITRAYAAVMRARGVRTPDVNGCPKLLRREAWVALAPHSRDWFLDAEVVMEAEARGWPIAEEPVVMAARAGGRSKVRARTTVEFAWNLWRWRGS